MKKYNITWTRFLVGACISLATVSSCTIRSTVIKKTNASPVIINDGIRSWPSMKRVEIDARICLRDGWLEQFACSAGSREHESILSLLPRGSDIHAALLLAGFLPGHPGSWTFSDGEYLRNSPDGDTLVISCRYLDDSGNWIQAAAADWLRLHPPSETAAPVTWVFAGSSQVAGPNLADPPMYAADYSGSIIGIVTFGDEIIALQDVYADSLEVEAPSWTAHTTHIPPIGTAVTIVITGEGSDE